MSRSRRRRFVSMIEKLESRQLLAAISWTGSAGDGLWGTAGNWSPAQVPSGADDVTINAPGTTIQVSTSNRSARSVVTSADLQLTGMTLTLGAGGINLSNAKILIGTTNGQFVAELTFLGSDVPGGVGIGGTGEVVFGGGVTGTNRIRNGLNRTQFNVDPDAQVLTIGSGVTLRGGAGTLDAFASTGAPAPASPQTYRILGPTTVTGSVVSFLATDNRGTVTMSGSSGLNYTAGLTNSGPITVTGGSLSVSSTLNNSGQITVSGGSLSITATLNNTGAITVTNTSMTLPGSGSGVVTATGSTVTLTGSFAQSAVSGFSRTGGVVRLLGTVTGGLALSDATGSWLMGLDNLFQQGVLSGGTYSTTGSARLVVIGGLFDGVTLASDLDVTTQVVLVEQMTVRNGLTLEGGAKILLGAANGTTSARIIFNGTDIPGGERITGSGEIVFGASGSNNIRNGLSRTQFNADADAQVVTIGSGVTLRVGGGALSDNASSGIPGPNPSSPRTFRILGPTAVTGTLALNQPVDNRGTVTATGSAVLNYAAGLTNSGPINLTNATLTLVGNWMSTGTITAVNSTLNLGGTFDLGALNNISRTGGVINITGVVTGNLALSNSSGSINLVGATLNNVSYSATGSAELVVTTAATFNGVTVGGPLNLAANSASLRVQNAFTLVGGAQILLGAANGSTVSTLTFFGQDVLGGQTVAGTGSIVLGGSANNTIVNDLRNSPVNNSVPDINQLYFAPGISISGRSGTISATASNNGNAKLILAGATTFAGPSGTVAMNLPVTNTGTVSVSGNTLLSLSSTLNNSGMLTVTQSTSAQFSVGGATVNSGVMTIVSSLVNLRAFTNSGMLDVTSGSTLAIPSSAGDYTTTGSGTTSFTGSSLQLFLNDPGQFGFSASFVNGGRSTYTNSTIDISSGSAWFNSGTLSFSGSTVATNNQVRFVVATLNSSGLLQLTNRSSFNSRLTPNHTGPFTVTDSTLTFTGAVTQAGLGPTFTRTGGRFNLQGTLTGPLALSDSTGSINVDGGTLTNATYTATGSHKLIVTTATLNNVILGGVVDATANNSSLFLNRDITFNSGGTILVGAADGTTAGLLQFERPAGSGPIPVNLLGTGTITFGPSAGNRFVSNILHGSFDAPESTRVNIGSGITISMAGGSTAGALGVFRVIDSAGTFSFGPGSVTVGTTINNRGTINVSGSTTFNSGISNLGVLNVSNASISITQTSWTSPGTINATGSTLNFAGTFPGSVFDNLSSTGGTINITGTVSGNLPLTDTTGSVNLQGAVFNGVNYTATGSAKLVISTATFTGVTVAGPVDAATNNANLRVFNSLALGSGAVISVGNLAGTTSSRISFDEFTGTSGLTVSGTGSIVLGSSAGNRFANNLPAFGGTFGVLGVATWIHLGSGISVSAGAVQFTGGDVGSNSGRLISAGSITVGAGTSPFNLFLDNRGTMTATGTNLAFNFGLANTGLVALTGAVATVSSTWSSLGSFTADNSTVTFGGSTAGSSFTNFSRTGGVVNLAGTVTGGLALTAATGSMNLLAGAVLSGGNYSATGGSKLFVVAGVLDGITAGGDLDLATSSGALTIRNGLTLVGSPTISLGNSAGTTTGTLTFEGIDLPNGQTLGGSGMIVAGASSGNRINNAMTRSGGNSLPDSTQLLIQSGITLSGHTLVLTQPGVPAQHKLSVYTAGPTVSGGSFTFDLPTGVLGGQVSAVSGTTVSFPKGVFIASPAAVSASGATLSFGGNWSNEGAISVSSSTVNLGGTFTQAGLGNFTRTGGTVNVSGQVSGDLTLDAATGSFVLVGGTLAGGVYSATGGAKLVVSSGTLDGYSALSDLDLGTVGGFLTVLNGLTLNGTLSLGNAGGSTSGVVRFDGADLNVGQILTGTGTVVFGGSVSNGITNRLTRTAGNVDPLSTRLQINPGVSIRGRSGLISGTNADNTIVFRGNLSADVAGGTLTVSANSTAQGTVTASGGTLLISGTLSNFVAASGTLSGGAYRAINNGTLRLAGVSVAVLSAPITLNGAGSRIFGASTGGTSVFATGLRVAGNGSITLASDNALSLSNLTNQGILNLSPGTSLNLSANFTNQATGRVNLTVSGEDPTLFPQILPAGAAVLGGALTVNLTGGYDPLVGATLPFLTASAVSGTFSAYNPVAGPSGNLLKLVYSATDISLSAAAPTPPPSRPVLVSTSDTGISNADNVTSDTTPTFTGTAVADALVRILADGIEVGSGIAAGGVYTITTSALGQGNRTITATASVGGDTPVPSTTSLTVRIDTTAPAITPPTPAPAHASDFSGAVVTYTATVSDNLDSAPTIQFSPVSGSVLPVGDTVVTITSTDQAGNISSAQFTVTVLPPIRPSNPVLALTSDTGGSNTDGITTDNTPTVTGTAADGALVRIFDNGVQVGSAIAAGGQYTITTTPLAEGVRTLSATSQLGTSAQVASLGSTSITIDTSAPTITPPTLSPVQAADLTGAVVTYTASATDTRDPSPAISFNPPSGTKLPVGSTQVTITSTDLAGNVSTLTFNAVVLAPVRPSVPTLATASDTGSSATDRITADNTLTLNGTAAAGSTVRIFADSLEVGSALVPTGGTYSLTTSPLADGARTLTVSSTLPGAAAVPATDSLIVTIDTVAPVIGTPTVPAVTATSAAGAVVNFNASASDTQDPNPAVQVSTPSGSLFPIGDTLVTLTATDAAGNTSSAQFTVTVNPNGPTRTATPSVPTLVASSDTGASTSDRITSDNTPTFTGTAPDNSLVRLFDGNVQVGTGIAAGGTYTITTSALSDGTRSLTATATLGSQTPSLPSAGSSLTIDTVAPVITAPSVQPVVATSAAGTVVNFVASASDTQDLNPVLQVSTPSGSVFPVGDTLVTLTATDAAGNSSTSQFTVTVNPNTPPRTAAPSTPTLVAASDSGVSNSDRITSDNTPTFTGTAPDNALVRIFDGDTQVGVGVASGGTYTITTSALADGARNLTATATLGGQSPSLPSAATSVTIDTAAPVIGTPSPAPVTADDGTGSIVFFSPSATDNSDPQPLLTSSSPSGTIFPVGNTVVTLTATDLAGNTSSSNFTVIVTPPAITPVVGGVDIQFGNGTGVTGITVPASKLTSIDTFSLGGGSLLQVAFDSRANQIVILRSNPDGSLDTSFGQNGFLRVSPPTDFATRRVQFDSVTGQIYLFGTFGPSLQPAIARFTQSGSLDLSFFSGGVLQPTSLTTADRVDTLVAVKGGFVIGGSIVKGSTRSSVLIKITNANTLDPKFASKGTFSRPGGPLDTISGLTVGPRGVLIATGTTSSGNIADNAVSASVLVLRFTAAGKLDTSFNRPGKGAAIVSVPGLGLSSGQRAVVQTDGKILVAANTAFTAQGALAGNFGSALIRLTTRGVLDTTFNASGRLVTLNPVLAPRPFASQRFVLLEGNIRAASVADLLDAPQSALVIVPGGKVRTLAAIAVGNDTRLRMSQIVGDAVDLQAQALTLTGIRSGATFKSGASLRGSLRLSNSGTLPARGTLPISIFLSSDRVIDASDLALPNLNARVTANPGKTSTVNVPFKAPATPGTYFLIVRLGSIPGVGDLTVANNIAASTVSFPVTQTGRPASTIIPALLPSVRPFFSTTPISILA